MPSYRMTPPDFYGRWPELELIELGHRAAFCYDEGNSLEHRFCKALGLAYGSPPRHWKWKTPMVAIVETKRRA